VKDETVIIRIPKDLKEFLIKQAAKEDRSLSSYIRLKLYEIVVKQTKITNLK
jgi:hypothetical protein